MTDDMIARLLYLHPDEWARIKTILLESHRIYVAEHTGSIYIKRMVRDHEQRMLATEGGKRGGNPALLPGMEDADGGDNPRRPITVNIYWNRLPSHLQTDEMRAAITEWHEYRQRKKILLTKESMVRQINQLTPLSAEQAVMWIHNAIDRNWRGLYPPSNGYGKKSEHRTREGKEFTGHVKPTVVE